MMDRRTAIKTTGLGLAGLVFAPGIANADAASIADITIEDVLAEYNETRKRALYNHIESVAKSADETGIYWKAFIDKAIDLNCRDSVTESKIVFEELDNTGDPYEPFMFTVGDVPIDGILTIDKDGGGEVKEIKGVTNPRPLGYDPSAGEIVKEADESTICEMVEIPWLQLLDVQYDEANNTTGRDVIAAAEFFSWKYDTPSAVDQKNNPTTFDLIGNYPNPFNPVTRIKFQTPSNSSKYTLKVYSINGQLVSTLFENQYWPEGTHEVRFNGSNLASGVYLYRMEMHDNQAGQLQTGYGATNNPKDLKQFMQKKMLLLK